MALVFLTYLAYKCKSAGRPSEAVEEEAVPFEAEVANSMDPVEPVCKCKLVVGAALVVPFAEAALAKDMGTPNRVEHAQSLNGRMRMFCRETCHMVLGTFSIA